jgi:hypothetical protein
MTDAELIAKGKTFLGNRKERQFDELEWAIVLLKKQSAGKGQDNERWRAAVKTAREYLECL